jgi:Zn-finger nucleic acid-binding protein
MQARSGLLCPVCQVELGSSERAGVVFSRCPRCAGVWLVRGAFDKLTASSAEAAAPGLAPDYRLSESAVDHGYANADLRPDDANQEGRIREHDQDSPSGERGTPRKWRGALFDAD